VGEEGELAESPGLPRALEWVNVAADTSANMLRAEIKHVLVTKE
jgi:hypothetical protein